MTSPLDTRGAPPVQRPKRPFLPNSRRVPAKLLGHRGYQEEMSFLCIIPQPQCRTKLIRELFWKFIRPTENGGLLCGILIPGSQHIRCFVGFAPQNYRFIEKWTPISEAKFNGDYEFAIKHGLAQWSHQLMDVQSWRPKWPKRQCCTLIWVLHAW